MINQIRRIESRLKNTRPDMKVHFFTSHEEYMTAYEKKDVKDIDVVFIDDITEADPDR